LDASSRRPRARNLVTRGAKLADQSVGSLGYRGRRPLTDVGEDVLEADG
jgi:hypothetical protein